MSLRWWLDHGWLIVVLLFAAALLYTWTWSDQIGELGNDGPSYLAMARHYAPFSPESRPNAELAAYIRFPPFYPLTLAWLDVGDNLYRAHAVTTSFLLLALAAFYGWLRLRGCSGAQAALLALVTAALPETWYIGLSVLSEYLYLLLSLLALALLVLYERSRRDEILYGAALFVVTATLTRTIGIALFPPLLLAMLRAPRRAALLAALIAVAPLLLWYIPHRGSDYAVSLQLHYGGGALAGLFNQLHRELPALRAGFTSDFSDLTAPNYLIDGLGILCLLAAVWQAARLRPEGLYALAYLAIVLVWPFPQEAQRFLWPVLPVLLGNLLLTLAALRRQAPDGAVGNIAAAGLAAMVAVMALPPIAHAGLRYREALASSRPTARGFRAWYLPDAGDADHQVAVQIAIIETMRRISRNVPPGDCVVATRPDLIVYYAQRYAVYPPLDAIPDPYFQKILRAPGCRYVYVDMAIDQRYPVPMHPLERLGSNIRVVDEANLSAGANALLTVAMLLELPEAGDSRAGVPAAGPPH